MFVIDLFLIGKQKMISSESIKKDTDLLCFLRLLDSPASNLTALGLGEILRTWSKKTFQLIPLVAIYEKAMRR